MEIETKEKQFRLQQTCRTGALGLLQLCAPIDRRLSLTPNLPDSQSLWTSQPFLCINANIRPNVLMRERCQLIRLTADVANLVFSPMRRVNNDHTTVTASRTLVERIRN